MQGKEKVISAFKHTEWADALLAKAYCDQADHLIQDRPRLLALLQLFYKIFLGQRTRIKVLDLGCGDGILGSTLKNFDPYIDLSAWDGSEDMLMAAKARLSAWPDVKYQQITFQEIIHKTDLESGYDFIVSSFAIHHLRHKEKRALFAQIQQLLNTGGFFLNLDTVQPDHPVYETFYNEVWRDWLHQRQEQFLLDEDILTTPERAKAKPENQYEPLSVQIRFLEEVGFNDVECFYRAGMFAMYGGRK